MAEGGSLMSSLYTSPAGGVHMLYVQKSQKSDHGPGYTAPLTTRSANQVLGKATRLFL